MEHDGVGGGAGDAEGERNRNRNLINRGAEVLLSNMGLGGVAIVKDCLSVVGGGNHCTEVIAQGERSRVCDRSLPRKPHEPQPQWVKLASAITLKDEDPKMLPASRSRFGVTAFRLLGLSVASNVSILD